VSIEEHISQLRANALGKKYKEKKSKAPREKRQTQNSQQVEGVVEWAPKVYLKLVSTGGSTFALAGERLGGLAHK
jgi:hypothetical protein